LANNRAIAMGFAIHWERWSGIEMYLNFPTFSGPKTLLENVIPLSEKQVRRRRRDASNEAPGGGHHVLLPPTVPPAPLRLCGVLYDSADLSLYLP